MIIIENTQTVLSFKANKCGNLSIMATIQTGDRIENLLIEGAFPQDI